MDTQETVQGTSMAGGIRETGGEGQKLYSIHIFLDYFSLLRIKHIIFF